MQLFLPLGFNRALVADETADFVLFAFTEKHDVCDGLTVLPIDEALHQKADLLDVLEIGTSHTLRESLALHIRRDAVHATLVVKNNGRHAVEAIFDCTNSRNVLSNRPSLKVCFATIIASCNLTALSVCGAEQNQELRF